MADATTSAPNSSKGASTDASDDKGAYDARQGSTSSARTTLALASAKAASKAPARDLRAGLGNQAVFDIDGLTGTVRQLARLDGFLTKSSGLAASKVAMNYVRANAAALGLKGTDLSTFSLRRDYVDVQGAHHLSWTQSAGGTTVFGNGLQATVTKDGRLVNVGGSPISGLTAPAVKSPDVASSRAAIGAAKQDVGESASVGTADKARRVLFITSAGIRQGWETITMSAERPMLSVIDAEDGRTLFRQDLGSHHSVNPAAHTPVTWITPEEAQKAGGSTAKKPRAPKAAKGLAYQYFPGAKRGGKAVSVNYTKRGWLKANAKILSGNNSHTWADVKDDDKPAKSEEIRPNKPGNWNYRMKKFNMKWASDFCNNPYPCSWNPNKPYSWKANKNQNGTQVFFYVNNFHDHLLKSPIGFTEAAGNFQKVNKTKKGKGKDAVRTQTMDGANSGGTGLPDGNHVDNANMNTPPDGHAPTMQMYLQHQPFTSYPDGDPFSPTNVGDEADTVYHEYTHGLSNRLVVDSNGRSTLGDVQAGAMGEAWSDWYAMDYLVPKFQSDKPGVADVVLFQYDGEGVFLDRTEPIDCKVGVSSPRCTGGETGHDGGYTYADYGKVGGGPEVHTDGEIWGQTLWDFRDRFGSKLSESLVTRAMELSANNPSFLDMRNAILLADLIGYNGKHQAAIWQVFAHRGMGYFAGSLGGNDASPGASFEVPPTGTAVGSVSGTVTDSETGDPVEGATVALAFQGSPFLTNPSTTTDADGEYSLGPVPFGTYPKLLMSAPGYDAVTQEVEVDAGSVTVDAALERDWASASGGATIDPDDVVGPDFGEPCAPVNAIDQSDVYGWSTTSDLVNGEAGPETPKSFVVKLPQAIDISRVEVNPTAICGDGASASTGEFSIRVSANGTDWSDPTTGSFLFDDLGSSHEVPLADGGTGVQYIEYTMLAPIVVTDNDPDTGHYAPGDCPGGGFSGCDYMDVTELRVYGS